MFTCLTPILNSVIILLAYPIIILILHISIPILTICPAWVNIFFFQLTCIYHVTIFLRLLSIFIIISSSSIFYPGFFSSIVLYFSLVLPVYFFSLSHNKLLFPIVCSTIFLHTLPICIICPILTALFKFFPYYSLYLSGLTSLLVFLCHTTNYSSSLFLFPFYL